jgi:NADH:ubiquinone oxidoreductase subunit 4 (subunit M)
MQLSVLTWIIAFRCSPASSSCCCLETEKSTPFTVFNQQPYHSGIKVWAYISYDITAGGYQFIQKADWLPALGMSYNVGVDGISLPCGLLAGIVTTCGTAISWNIDERPREFFSYLMFLAASVYGVFVRLTCSCCFSSLNWPFSPNI